MSHIQTLMTISRIYWQQDIPLASTLIGKSSLVKQHLRIIKGGSAAPYVMLREPAKFSSLINELKTSSYREEIQRIQYRRRHKDNGGRAAQVMMRRCRLWLPTDRRHQLGGIVVVNSSGSAIVSDPALAFQEVLNTWKPIFTEKPM
eukprot:4011662-Karenia_brevis.AAC.1